MQLSRAPVQSTLLSQRIASAQRVTKVVVRANGDDRSKIVREYREDSDEVVVPGQEKKADNALYVDQIPAAVSFTRGPNAPLDRVIEWLGQRQCLRPV